MSIAELGAIGELVGGVAVIGSLIFVGIQLRTTTRTLRTTATYDALKNNIEVHNALFDDPALAVTIAGLEDGTQVELDDVGRAKFRYLMRSAMFHIAGQQFLHRRGIFDDDVWQQQVAWARNFLATPVGSEWWIHDQQVAAYPRDFVKLLNEDA